QDLTAYGRDRRDGTTLSRLLRELARIDGLRWIRLLYNYPRYVTEELLDTIAGEEKVCSYIDMPLQHISDRMLRAMRRERDGAALDSSDSGTHPRCRHSHRIHRRVSRRNRRGLRRAGRLRSRRTLRTRRRVPLFEGRGHGGGDAGRTDRGSGEAAPSR